MKLWYKTVLEGMGEEVYEYVLLESGEPCCQDMKEALNDLAVGFGEFKENTYSRENTLCFGDYKWGSWDLYPINYCPFCGVKVEAVEREVVKRVIKRHRVTKYLDNVIEVPVKQREVSGGQKNQTE